MADYSQDRKDAYDDLLAAGKVVVLTRKTQSGEYDTSTGSAPTTESSITGAGIFTRYTQYEINNELVQQEDRKLIFAGLTIDDVIEKGDLYNGLRVLRTTPLNIDESGPIIQTVQLRK